MEAGSPVFPADAEFFHLGLQSAALEAESICGASGAADFASRFALHGDRSWRVLD